MRLEQGQSRGRISKPGPERSPQSNEDPGIDRLDGFIDWRDMYDYTTVGMRGNS